MNIEAMTRYPRNLRVTRPLVDVNLVQLQGYILALIEKIQELTIPRLGRPQVWYTGCYMEGHLANECSRMRGLGPPQNMIVTPSGPMGGVVQVSMNSSFHHPTPYHTFPGG
jgi:hypothetical protein